MTCPALTLARLKARQADMAREASRYAMSAQKPYRAREAWLMNEEARLRSMIAEKQPEAK